MNVGRAFQISLSCLVVGGLISGCQPQSSTNFAATTPSYTQSYTPTYGICDKPTTLKPFPHAMISSLARDRTDDPDNYRVTSLMARCVNNNPDVLDVCGTAAHMNSVGYIDRKHIFLDALHAKNLISTFRNTRPGKKRTPCVNNEFYKAA
jgi:hypothetical protein